MKVKSERNVHSKFEVLIVSLECFSCINVNDNAFGRIKIFSYSNFYFLFLEEFFSSASDGYLLLIF